MASNRPRRFDRNLVVVGAGSAGLVCAYIAAVLKAKVSLIEKNEMGGDCLNTGCVPSKALIRTAGLLAQINRAAEFGVRHVEVDYAFSDVMERVQRIIKTIAPHDSIVRYTALGVDVIHGSANITSPNTVEVNGKTLTTRNIIIAAGAQPFVPPIAGIDKAGVLTSENIWELRELPEKLVVLGGGPIGSELAQCFARFGSRVTQVEMLPRLLMREDPEVSELIKKQFATEGVNVLVNHKAREIINENGKQVLVCDTGGKEARIEFDKILAAVGRKANIENYGLRELGIETTAQGTIKVNDYLQTNYPNIFACGDVAGPYQFTHTASHQAWYATVNALFAPLKKFRVDYSVIPWATFTDPEVARVGLNEIEAKEKNIPYEISRYGINDLDRAITDEDARGFVKVLTVPGRDKILGATIAGSHAGELITEYISAMRHGFGLNKILGTIHIYPTWSEANKYTAGIWKKAHASATLLRIVEWFNSWRRG